ncbi:MAG: amidase, partial [Syntrophales bacterium]
MDFGTLLDMVPLTRGPSGRITRLRIEGTRAAVTIGKELEIRRWLSPSHLYSSAFIIRMTRNERGIPDRFV